MKISIVCFTAAMASICQAVQLYSAEQRQISEDLVNEDQEIFAQADSEMLDKLMGGGGGGGGGPSGGCAQNTPSINIIDNARIMMMPGNIPAGGSFMAQENSEPSNGSSQSLA